MCLRAAAFGLRDITIHGYVRPKECAINHLYRER